MNKVKFIYTSALGLSGFIFNDFGKEHYIINKTGDEPLSFFIENITKEKEGKVTINIEDENKTAYDLSNYISFKNVKGMSELNDINPTKIKILSNKTISIGDTRNYQDYISGGIIKEVFVPFKKEFLSFEESLIEPFNDIFPGQSINMKKDTKELYNI